MISLKNFYQNHKIKIIFGIFATVVIFVVLGCIIFPSIFYDNWIWKYFWGPIVSDAVDHPVSFNGVLAEQKYTFMSEIIYGFLIIIALYGFYQLLKKWNNPVDWRFCLAILPYVIVGSITRVLEDSGFFNEPLVYWFISPLIYLQIFIWVIVFFLIGYYLQQRFKKRYLTVNSVLFSGGVLILLPFIFFTLQWIIGNQWNTSQGIRFDVFFLIVGLIFAILFLVYAFSRLFKNNNSINVYSERLNLAMIVAHMLDGITSYVSIYDPLNMGLPHYIEKHPASDFIMEIWPPLFPIVKFLLIISVIYVFDVIYKDELSEYWRLINLLKIGIFILGFAPGLRDLIRVVMGV